MAKPIVLVFQGQEAKFDLKRIDRAKLYGKRRRIPLDPQGELCQRAELTEDGAVLIRPGMTAQGYFNDESRWIPNKNLVGIDADGNPLEVIPSTLGTAVEAVSASPEELLDLNVLSVYMLDPQELPEGFDVDQILRFKFNYRTDYHAEVGYLVHNDDGYFAIIGNPTTPAWLELDQVVEETYEDETEESDDLDFEMF